MFARCLDDMDIRGSSLTSLAKKVEHVKDLSERDKLYLSGDLLISPFFGRLSAEVIKSPELPTGAFFGFYA